ncbi:MAG: amidohydrolase family protein [Acidobacteria bacterium]|nr:amidohydrolase family protein [Acidobacteriota bacterium]
MRQIFPSSIRVLAAAVSLWAAEPVDLIVSGREVVTMDAQYRVVANGAVAVRADRIVAVGARADIDRRFTAKRRIDRPNALITPGLINTHTHAPMSLLRGIADDLRLQEWLEKYIFPAEAKNVTADFCRAGTDLAVLEMLLGGTTTYTDMYYFEEVIADATAKAGMRGVLGQTIIQFPVPDAKTPELALQRTEAFLKRFAGNPLITAAPAPHAIYTNADGTLQAARALANKYGAPLLIHVSETKREFDESRAKRGMTPVAALARLGVFDGRTVAAHGVWLDEDDVATLAAKRVGVAHCPSSNMKLASGIAPLGKLMKAGVAVGLGPDGPAGSNNDFNLFEEIDLAGKLQKIAAMDPEVLPARDAFAMATIGGARVLGMASDIGSLEAGKKADLITVSLDSPHAYPMFNVYSQLVNALKAADVTDVVINGRTVVLARKPLTLDPARVRLAAERYMGAVAKSVAR